MRNADLTAWAHRNSITPLALADLLQVLAANDHAPPLTVDDKSSEARAQSLIRLAAPKHGFWFTRNNVGAFENPKTGQWVRYGLANETAQQNESVKSADLIGFHKRVIVETDVGKTIAQFSSLECKRADWSYKATKHEIAQARWRDFINLNGGFAAFATGPEVFTK